MFNFHLKRELNDVSRELAYMLNKYQSVKNFCGMKVHSGQHCSTKCKIKKVFKSSLTFNILSQKCSDKRKFGIEGLQYLYRKMSKNGGNRWCGCRGNRVCHERFLYHSLSKI